MFQQCRFFRSFLLVVFVFFIFFMPSIARAAQGSTQNVLVLNSYHSGYPWSDQVNQGIKDVFERSGSNIELYSVYMDLKRTSYSDEYILEFKDFIRVKYQKVHFDLVLASDNDALEFLRKFRDEVFPGVPVVFLGINDFELRMLDGRMDITGVVESTSYAETIEAALKIKPATQTIIVVTDNTTTGRAHYSALVKAEPLFSQKVKFQHLSLGDLTLPELGDKLAFLVDNAVVLLLYNDVDRNGVLYGIKESIPFLTARARVPCFVVNYTRLGSGALGGKVTNGYYHGIAGAEMAVRILQGSAVRDIPVCLESPNKYMFDHAVMRRFHISQEVLPQGSVVMNKPVAFFVKYRTEAMVGGVVLFLLCGIILILMFFIRYQAKVKGELRQSEQKYRLLFERAGDAIYIHDESGGIFVANPMACKMLGYAQTELLSMTVGQVDCPEESLHVPERIARLMAQNHYLFESVHQRKDGSRIPVEVSVQRITWEGQPAMMSICRDITDRKKVDEIMRLSEERYRRLLSSTTDYIYTVQVRNGCGVGTVHGSGCLAVTGYSAEEYKADPELWFRMIYQDDRDKVVKMVESALKGFAVEPLEHRIYHRNGTVRWLTDTLVLKKDGAGQVVSYDGLVHDITERKLAEEAVRREQVFSNVTMNSIPGPFYVLDENGRYVRWNDYQRHEVIGKPEELIAGFPAEDTIHPDDRALIRMKIANVLRAGIEESVEGRVLLRGGPGFRWFLMTGRRMLVDGKVFLVGTGVDITARKKAEEVLKEAKESAEAANRAKSEFLNNIAHDFRTPVHAIMGFSSLLHSEHMTEKQKKFAGVINESSHDLLRLVEELLDVSRLESGRLELKVSEFDVRKCLDHAVKVAQIELIDKEVKLRHWMEGSILPVKGDETRFNQILANLIGNAVKYTDKGEIIVKIDGDQQGCSPGKCRIRLSVKDTGLGIPQDKLPRLFDAFTRFHEFEGGKARGGEGLGLYIVKTLVDLMKGKISVTSEVGKGSEFIVTLDFDVA